MERQELIDGIVAVLEKAKADIQARMEAENINASGRSSRSWRVVQYDGGVRLLYGDFDTAPLETLEVGRPGGNVPGGFRMTKDGVLDVSNTFKAILIRWAEEKGIPDFGWGRATMLGRRIAEQGTLRHTNPVDVYSTIVMDVSRTVMGNVAVSVSKYIHEQLTQQ